MRDFTSGAADLTEDARMVRKTLIGIAVLLVAMALCTVVLFHFKQRSRGTRAVDELLALSKIKISRPVHRGTAVAGTTADCYAKVFQDSAIPDLSALKAGIEPTPAVLNTRRPLEDLPEKSLLQLKNARAWTGDVLACSRRAQVAQGLYVNSYIDDSIKRVFSLSTLNSAAKVTAYLIRVHTSENHPDLALQRCADGLAFSRDISLVPSLLNSMVAAASTRIITAACIEALNAADPASRAQFSRELSSIRTSLPKGAEMMDAERIGFVLLTLRPALSEEDVARLPPEFPRPEYSLPLTARAAVGFFDDYLRALSAVPDLPPADRAKAITAAKALFPLPDALLGAFGPNGAFSIDYTNYFHRLDDWRTLLLVLQVGADGSVPGDVSGAIELTVTRTSPEIIHVAPTSSELKNFITDFKVPAPSLE